MYEGVGNGRTRLCFRQPAPSNPPRLSKCRPEELVQGITPSTGGEPGEPPAFKSVAMDATVGRHPTGSATHITSLLIAKTVESRAWVQKM